jgi:two-component system chemotaxis sensor kinase CheA
MDQSYSDGLQRELMGLFGDEAREHVEAISRNLLALEACPPADIEPATWREIMREAHSLKGAAGAVTLPDVGNVAHRLESLFTDLADGRLELGPEVLDVLYRALDAISTLVQSATGAGTATVDLTDLLSGLDRLTPTAQPQAKEPPAAKAEQAPEQGATEPGTPEAGAPEQETPEAGAPEKAAPDGQTGTAAGVAQQPEETVRLTTAKLDTLLAQMGELQVTRIEATQRLVELQELEQSTAAWEEQWRKSRVYYRILALSSESGPQSAGAGDRTEGAGDRSGPGDWETIRPLLRFLEANETHLGLLRKKVATLTRVFKADSRHMAQVTADMEDGIRQTRMLPVATVLEALPRIVRDLARDRGKEISLKVEGAETGADRSVLEQIKDPLLHLLRNAVDHGIETPQARVLAGKTRRGTITITVAQQGDGLSIQVADDGSGVDLASVRATAVKKRRLTEEAAAALDDRRALWLIFDSGLSTSPIMTEISGRGVGLDVVRERVEHLHGMLDVENSPGLGMRFTFTVPLTVASTDCLLVQAGTRTVGSQTHPLVFAIPISNVIRLIGITPEQIGSAQGRDVIRLEDEPLALWRLTDVLGLESGSAGGGRATRPVVVVGAAEKRMALLVDAVVGAQETVTKSLPQPLLRVRNVAGATILGTGQVVVILQVADLFSSVDRVQPAAAQGAPEGEGPEPGEARVPVIMIVDDSITTRTLESNILRASGYQTRMASDGLDAWTQLQTEGCDLLVSDVMMPNLDGFGLTAKLRADKRYKNLPVVLVTSLDSSADRERGVEAGADAYIVKGAFDQGALLDAVGRLI